MNEKIENQMYELLKVTEKYGLSTQYLEKEIQFMKNFAVTVPIIGGFSTGKSSMLNALLDKNVLKTQIGAETAVPTELTYGKNTVTAYKDERAKHHTIDELKTKPFTVEDTDYIHVEMESPFLKEIPTIKVVDMPGFDSGIEAHNVAIDQYLPNSLAYILTFSADEPVVKESIIQFLNEIKLHEVPIYVVVTKSDKVTEEVLQQNIEAIRQGVIRHLGVEPEKVVAVWSRRNKDITALQNILLDIQKNSDILYTKYFQNVLNKQAHFVLSYLEKRLSSMFLTSAELIEKEATLKKQLENLQNIVSEEQAQFMTQLTNTLNQIEKLVEQQLKSNRNALEASLLKGENIQPRLNTIIRNAVTAAIKTEFEPKLHEHLLGITDLLQVDEMNTEIQFESTNVEMDQMMKNLTTGTIPLILKSIGLKISGPVAMLIVTVVNIFAEMFLSEKKQDELKEQARQKLDGEIFPAILSEVRLKVESELRNYTETVHALIQEEVNQQYEVLQQAMEDVQKEKTKEEEQWQQQEEEMKRDAVIVKECTSFEPSI